MSTLPQTPHTLSRRAVLTAAASSALLQACGGGGEVSALPVIVTEPADAAVLAGAPATFAVAASGEGPLTYQWQRDGRAVADASGPAYTLAAAVLADHGSRFTVTVTNSRGSVTSRAATLAVAPAVSLLAGCLGGAGYLDGPGAAARFEAPGGIAVSPAGDILVSSATVLRKITPQGVVSTAAGHYRNAGSTDGQGTAARFDMPEGMCFDGAGNLYIADAGAHTIRMMSPAGTVTTVAGTAGNSGAADGPALAAGFSAPRSVVFDSAGNLFVADAANCTIRKITPAGMVSTFAGQAGTMDSTDGTGAAARFNYPAGLAIDSADNLYVADSDNHMIRKVTPAGEVTRLAGSGAPGWQDGAGAAAQFRQPMALTLRDGVLYVAEKGNDLVRAVSLDGTVTTLAGGGAFGSDDGTGPAARFCGPTGIAHDPAGNLYVADFLNHTIRKIVGNVVTTFAGAASQPGSTDAAGAAARFDGPRSVAADAAGNAYVADAANHTIRKVTPDGTTRTFAGTPGQSGAADGTGAAARFNSPQGVAVDAAGNVYVADSSNHSIRKITPAGVATTLAGSRVAGHADGTGAAARFFFPTRLAVDAAGNVYVCDSENHTIRKITPTGEVTTLAGAAGMIGAADGPGTLARFKNPWGIAVGAAGVFVADTGNNTIRLIAADGAVKTFAGTAGTTGNSDEPGADARFNFPRDLAADAVGNLYVADTANCLIRKIDPAARVTTAFGQVGRVGVQTGAAPGAFAAPFGIAYNAAGPALYVADKNENAVLKLTVG